MKKVFIADAALKDHRGHHYALTKCMSDVFLSAGYKVIWITNLSFKKELVDSDVEIAAIFSESTYDSYKKVNASKGAGRLVPKVVAKPRFLKRCYQLLPVFIRTLSSPVLRRLVDGIRNILSGNSNASNIKTSHRKQGKNKTIELERPPKQRPEIEFYNTLTKFGARPDDLVLFHTCDANTYSMVYQLLMTELAIVDWYKLPTIHLSTPYDEVVMPHNKSCLFINTLRRLGYLGVINKKVFLYAENDRLATHLSNFTRLSFSGLEIPLIVKEDTEKPRSDSNKLNIVYLGAARTEKGFIMLPDVLRQISAREDIHFIFQISPQIMGYTADVSLAVRDLKQQNCNALTLIEESQSPSEYEECLRTADVILLCYDPERYKYRSSGIVVEAIMHQVTVIATKDTIPSYIASGSGIEVDYGDASAIVDAIETIADSIEGYREIAQDRKIKYILEHGSEQFLTKILQNKTSEIKTDGSITAKIADSTSWGNLIKI